MFSFMRVSILLFCFFISLSSFAQTPPSNLEGKPLRDWFKQNYYDGKHSQLGYSNARRRMYNYIDNHNNQIEGVYGGYKVNWNYGGSGTNPWPINCEHTVPQSFFGSSEPMKSDIHHLFPTYNSWNSKRSNFKFNDIADNVTTDWMILDQSQGSIPTSNIDGYSEHAGAVFEPREEHKGNVARAVFYFYTVYPTQAGSITDVAAIEKLLEWHVADPVDQDEIDRNNAIHQYQGNYNPYILWPNYAEKAWDPSGTGSGQPGFLLFSEYIEGTGMNKGLELVNLTGSSIDLASYSIKKQTDGSGAWSSSINLNGVLSDQDVYTICHDQADNAISSTADFTSSSTVLDFDGNDPLGLFYQDSLVDAIGYHNSPAVYGEDVTMIRKAGIQQPSIVFDPNDWEVRSKDDFSDFGTHNSSLSVSQSQLSGLQLYPNPCENQLNLLLPTFSGKLRYQIISSTGAVLKQGELSGKSLLRSLDLSELPKGFYFIRLSAESKSAVGRFAKL